MYALPNKDFLPSFLPSFHMSLSETLISAEMKQHSPLWIIGRSWSHFLKQYSIVSHGPGQKPGHTRGCQSMPNVNIHETEKIKLAWTHQQKRRRQPLKKNDGHGCNGEEKKVAAETEMDRQLPGKYEKIWNDIWHDWKQRVLENDGEDWPTKMWWSLDMRNIPLRAMMTDPALSVVVVVSDPVALSSSPLAASFAPHSWQVAHGFGQSKISQIWFGDVILILCSLNWPIAVKIWKVTDSCLNHSDRHLSEPQWVDTFLIAHEQFVVPVDLKSATFDLEMLL